MPCQPVTTRSIALLAGLILLTAAIGLTSAKPAFAATYEVEFKDGRKTEVEAPYGATVEDLLQVINRQTEIERAQEVERTKRIEERRQRREKAQEKIDELARLAVERAELRRKDNPELYEMMAERAEVYRNCIVDKMAGVTEETAQNFVKQSCNEIADDPSLYQRWKYSD
jgi:hypothetical protein